MTTRPGSSGPSPQGARRCWPGCGHGAWALCSQLQNSVGQPHRDGDRPSVGFVEEVTAPRGPQTTQLSRKTSLCPNDAIREVQLSKVTRLLERGRALDAAERRGLPGQQGGDEKPGRQQIGTRAPEQRPKGPAWSTGLKPPTAPSSLSHTKAPPCLNFGKF